MITYDKLKEKKTIFKDSEWSTEKCAGADLGAAAKTKTSGQCHARDSLK